MMQGEGIIKYINGNCHVFTFNMQDEVILEHTNAKAYHWSAL